MIRPILQDIERTPKAFIRVRHLGQAHRARPREATSRSAGYLYTQAPADVMCYANRRLLCVGRGWAADGPVTYWITSTMYLLGRQQLALRRTSGAILTNRITGRIRNETAYTADREPKA